MKRKVKAGKLDVDFEDRALIVNYEVEATVLGDFGAEMQSEKKSHAKRIRLKKLDENTNVPALAQEIVEKCKLIHPSKLPTVENLLFALQQREVARSRRSDSSRDMAREARRKQRKEGRSSGRSSRRRDEDEDDRGGGRGGGREAVAETATMDDLDDYLEKMYDEKMKNKVRVLLRCHRGSRAAPAPTAAGPRAAPAVEAAAVLSLWIDAGAAGAGAALQWRRSL